MTSSFRRTLDMSDLLDASDDEMDALLISTNENLGSEPNVITADGTAQGVTSTDPTFIQSAKVDANNRHGSTGVPPFSAESPADNCDDEWDRDIRHAPRGMDLYTTLGNISYEVNGINGVVRENVSRLLNREQSFEGLLDRSEHMNLAGDMYHQSTEMLNRRMAWRQRRGRLVLTAMGIIIAVFLFLPLIAKWLGPSGAHPVHS